MVEVLLYTLFFILGAAIGSFVQVIVSRLNVAPIAKSRSKCLSCGEALRVSDLVPIFSYLFLRGKCRYCKVPFGAEALFVEIGFGIIFILLLHFMLLGAAFPASLGWLVYYTMLFITLGVIALYDLRHTYIPTAYLLWFSALAFVLLVMRFQADPSATTLLGPLVVALPFLLIWMFSKGRAIGFGDVILFMAIGAFFGIEQGLAVVLVAVWLGAIIGIGVMVIQKLKGKKHSSVIPFVPFIVLAFLIVLFTDTSIFSLAGLFA